MAALILAACAGPIRTYDWADTDPDAGSFEAAYPSDDEPDVTAPPPAPDNREPVGEPCDGPDEDLCARGVLVEDPEFGWICMEEEAPALAEAEQCNGADDDCDGSVDEDFGLGLACDGADNDLCQEGVTVCDQMGSVTCSDATDSSPELCNGQDDDCDGNVDEDGCPDVERCDGVDQGGDGAVDEYWFHAEYDEPTQVCCPEGLEMRTIVGCGANGARFQGPWVFPNVCGVMTGCADIRCACDGEAHLGG